MSKLQGDTSQKRTLIGDNLRVAALEVLMREQTSAAAPWAPVTDYSSEGRLPIEEPHASLIRDVFRPSNVLDVGCGYGHLVRLLNSLGINSHGCDKQWHTEDIGNRNAWRFDVTDDDPDELLGNIGYCDLVVCREVLEHLTIREIAKAVRTLVRLSTKFIYVTTRFAKNPNHLLDVDTADDLDPTHITMLTQPFLRLLFVLEGCKHRPDLEAKMDWMHKGRVLVYEVA